MEKDFIIKKYISLFLSLFLIITSGCSVKIFSPKYNQVESDTVYIIEPELEPKPTLEPEPQPELAYILASIPNFKINGDPLEVNITKTISTGKHTVTFEGRVKMTVPSKPIIEAEKEQANAAKFTACISALPLCPVTLLLMQIAFEDTSIVTAKCYGKLEFYALGNISYYIQLENSENKEPKINVSGSNNQTVSEITAECDVSNTTEMYRDKN